MSAIVVGDSYLPQNPEFWRLYATLLQATTQDSIQSAVEPSAPPMNKFDQITYFLAGKIQYEWPHDELDQMAAWWRQITGGEMSALLKSDRDIPNLIQTIKFRETGLVRMYHQATADEQSVSRATLMELHAKFFADYGCRITDFTTDQSFIFTVENHIQSQFA